MPLDAFVPAQPPAAVHEVELVEDQVTVDILPDAMLVGFAENATVGSGLLPTGFPPAASPEVPPLGYALFDPGSTGTPPGTSTSTMLTFVVTIAWSDPSWTTLVPGPRSVMGMVTAWERYPPLVSGYGQGVGCA